MRAPGTKTVKPRDPPPGDGGADHSTAILQQVERESSDQVTCVRVFANYYRCNWWAPLPLPPNAAPLFQGLELSNYRVRKSRFFRATVGDAQQLVLEDATSHDTSAD